MVDITKHLYNLNLTLQGKYQIITNIEDKIKAFKCKLWEKHLKNEDLKHFPTSNIHKSGLGEAASYQNYPEGVGLTERISYRRSLLIKWTRDRIWLAATG